VIGCGAVAERFHIPILQGHAQVQLVAFVDKNIVRAKELAAQYQVDRVLSDAQELSSDFVDGALIATPPFVHAPCAIELAIRGIHAFVEKPIALNEADATAMVAAAESSGTILSVGLFRRLLPATRLMGSLVESGLLGHPVSFDVDEGSIYGWEAATLGNMRREMAGGGVLIDVGSHAIDRLLFVLPGSARVIEYQDNSRGGIESDCELRLAIDYHGRTLSGRIRLSRTRKLRNTMQIVCERGSLEVSAGERFEVSVRPQGVALRDEVLARVRDVNAQVRWADEPQGEWWEIFRAELDDWLEAIQHGTTPRLDARSSLPTVRLIDECYQSARRLFEPGVDEGLIEHTRPADDAIRTMAGAAMGARRVLITGATGFIGCRVAEMLSIGDSWSVRALVHNPANASRVARLPVEMVMGDMRSKADIQRLVDGVDTIVHCAIAPPWASHCETKQITIGGTRNLTDAAIAAGIERLVHLSSFGVHGNDVTGTIDESTPLRPPPGDRYCASKAASERVVLDAARRGLPAIVLRPTNVYGPYSKTFVTRPVEYLSRGRFILAGSGTLPSNTIYVDNLVEAIRCALAAEPDKCGEVFLVSDGDDFTWGEFYRFFADAIGAELRTGPVPPKPARSNWPGRRLADWTAHCWRACRGIMISHELKELGRRVLDTDPVGRIPRDVLQRSPRLRRWLRNRLKMEQAPVYRRREENSNDVFCFTSRSAATSIEKARRLLGYQPIVARDTGMQRTLDWLRYAEIVK
jgi:predicted dehydrogenase/nucleoside-diphosphate-sugar epimerase